jgi:translation initiation factor 2B subunit (eIF-2B alpha/beta/delta family)
MATSLLYKGRNKETTQHVNSQIDLLANNIVFRKIKSPNEIANAIFKLFECAVQMIDWRSPQELH